MKHFTAADGRLSRYPTTYEHSLECKSPFYDDGVKCTVCNEMSIKYTHNHKCRYCVRLDAVNFYNIYKGNDLVFTHEETGDHYARLPFGRFQHIPDDKYNDMLKYVKIAQDDHAFTVSPDPCSKKAHYGLKRLGKCQQCREERAKPTARQEAMSLGKTWYTPDVPCIRCGTTALKSVHNGQCQGCVPPAKEGPDNRETSASVMMRDNPDMILSKSDAISYGFKVYRTGQPCKHGHNAWRYVSTGTCVDCLRGDN